MSTWTLRDNAIVTSGSMKARVEESSDLDPGHGSDCCDRSRLGFRGLGFRGLGD